MVKYTEKSERRRDMFGLGLPEILLILVVILLIFGAARLPEIGRSMGKALSEFKKGMQDNTEKEHDKNQPKD
jgi:TatA/E family protein of Tat protein translocase